MGCGFRILRKHPEALNGPDELRRYVLMKAASSSDGRYRQVPPPDEGKKPSSSAIIYIPTDCSTTTVYEKCLLKVRCSGM